MFVRGERRLTYGWEKRGKHSRGGRDGERGTARENSNVNGMRPDGMPKASEVRRSSARPHESRGSGPEKRPEKHARTPR